MLKIKLINSEATLNNFFAVSGYAYVPGENAAIAFRLHHIERDIRLVASNLAAIVTMDFSIKSSTTPLTLTATNIDALDRSMWKVSLTQAQTLDLSGSNVEVSYDVAGDGSVIYKSVIRNALQRTILSGDC